MLIDITRTIGLDDLAYPGDPRPHVAHSYVQPNGGGYTVSSLTISSHAGTHLDVPRHFYHEAPPVDTIPLERFCLPTLIVDARGYKEIGPQHVDWDQVRPGMAVLFRTDNESLPRSEFDEHHIVLTLTLAQKLIEAGVQIVGFDYINFENYYDRKYPLHKLLLGADVLILEDVDLREVETGEYRLYCFPLRLANAEASPCRAVLESIS